MDVKIRFDNDSAVASISLAGWATPLVERLSRYFNVCDEMLQLDYAHLSVENDSAPSNSRWGVRTARENFVAELEHAAGQGSLALTLVILGFGSAGVKDSSSILAMDDYVSAEQAFRDDLLEGVDGALRETILEEIAPHAIWVEWLLRRYSYERSSFMADQHIMGVLVGRTSEDYCNHILELIEPEYGESKWAFEQLVEQHWEPVYAYLKKVLSSSLRYQVGAELDFVLSLFKNSKKIRTSRRVCEHVLNQEDPVILQRLIEHCRAIYEEDVRSLFLRWQSFDKKEKNDAFKECVAKACLALAASSEKPLPRDIALAAAWHEFEVHVQPAEQRLIASLRELPSDAWGRDALWSQLGPAAREAWRQDLFESVTEQPELAQGLLYFSCLWLGQEAFGEVEPVFLRLMDSSDYLDFASRLASDSPRRVLLRTKGLLRSKQGALDFEGPASECRDIKALPSVGAETWLSDPSVERVIHRALSEMEEEFCREYSVTWGEDEEVHTARLLAQTKVAADQASQQLRQLSTATRVTYPSLSVQVRQPSKHEEGAETAVGAPLGADVLFLTSIVDKGKTVIQRATLVQVKKRRGTGSGKEFSKTIDLDLQQCADMLQQSEHAYYLFATPAWPRPTLWVAPARLVGNLTQMHTSKSSVPAIPVRDASCSYADFFLRHLVGLWSGDEDKGLLDVAKGNPRLGRTPRHVVDIEVRLQSD